MELSFLKYLSILHNKIDLVNIMWLNIVLPWGRWSLPYCGWGADGGGFTLYYYKPYQIIG